MDFTAVGTQIRQQGQPSRSVALCSVDHIVYGCADLNEGIERIEKLTGVHASHGGSHPGVGTHNALLSLGDDVYFEIIAPDPSQTEPVRPRPFGLDDARNHNKLVAFAVHPLVSAGSNIEMLATTMEQEGFSPGPIHRMSRRKPDGSELNWAQTSVFLAAGARPWIIDWGDATSPAKTSPSGCRLAGLTCYVAEQHGTAVQYEHLLSRMGVQPFAASGQNIQCRDASFADGRERQSTGFLLAELDTPLGRITIG